VAESVTAHGGVVHIVGIEGEADPAIAGFPHTWVNWGEIGRMIAALRREGGGQVVIAGAVTRPDLTRVRPDAGLLRNLPLIARLLAGGDDAVLTRVVRFLEDNGLQVHGVHEVAPDLLVGSGPLGANTLGTLDCVDAELGFAVRQALGAVDAGQAVVVVGGRVLAIEGAEGTDAMLQRAAELASGGGQSGPAGVLTKGPKPGQEMRVDMPVVGPRTVAQAAAAGLAGVAVEAAAVLVLDRPEAIGVADARGLAVQGFPALPCGASRARAAPQPVRTARVLGRVRPRRRDVVDIETGLAGVWALAPFATGFGAVVLRRYILAIEAAEGTQAMLTRAAALRR